MDYGITTIANIIFSCFAPVFLLSVGLFAIVMSGLSQSALPSFFFFFYFKTDLSSRRENSRASHLLKRNAARIARYDNR